MTGQFQQPVRQGRMLGLLELVYPSSLPRAGEPDYVKERVLIEFGARATTEPSHVREVSAYLHAVPELKEVAFPQAVVNVLSAERTFWEKATLIHFENTRSRGPRMRERYARHWYDLYQLDQDPVIGPSARADIKARDHVIRIKSIHYGGGGVDYKACAQGGLRLKPDPDYSRELEQDFDAMRTAGMFVKEPPSFADILGGLADLEVMLNK